MCAIEIFRNEQTGTTGRRGRLPTEPGPCIEHGYNSPLVSSPIKSPPYNSGATGADSDDSSYKCKLNTPTKINHTNRFFFCFETNEGKECFCISKQMNKCFCFVCVCLKQIKKYVCALKQMKKVFFETNEVNVFETNKKEFYVFKQMKSVYL